MAYRISERGLALIKRHEGLVLHVYKCQSGAQTIGYGHKLSDGEKKTQRFKAGITQGEADSLLQSDVKWVEQALTNLVKVPLGQNQVDALGSMVFNCGPLPLSQTLGRVLNAGQYDSVPHEMMRWVHLSDKTISRVLLARRAAEAHLWSTPDESTPAV